MIRCEFKNAWQVLLNLEEYKAVMHWIASLHCFNVIVDYMPTNRFGETFNNIKKGLLH